MSSPEQSVFTVIEHREDYSERFDRFSAESRKLWENATLPVFTPETVVKATRKAVPRQQNQRLVTDGYFNQNNGGEV